MPAGRRERQAHVPIPALRLDPLHAAACFACGEARASGFCARPGAPRRALMTACCGRAAGLGQPDPAQVPAEEARPRIHIHQRPRQPRLRGCARGGRRPRPPGGPPQRRGRTPARPASPGAGRLVGRRCGRPARASRRPAGVAHALLLGKPDVALLLQTCSRSNWPHSRLTIAG